MFGLKTAAQRFASSNRKALVLMLTIATMTVITASTLLSVKQVTVIDNGNAVMSRTFCNTVASFTEKSGVVLGEHDEIYPALDSRLTKTQTIRIERAFPVTISTADAPLTVYTTGKTVAAILEKNGVTLGEMDIVTPSLDTVVTQNDAISITKVTQDMVSVEEDIPYKTVQVENRTMARGTTKVVTNGVNGKKQLMYTVTYHNGEEASREFAGEQIISEPVNKVVQYGTQYSGLSSRGTSVSRVSNPSDELNYKKVVTCRASAYDLSYASCGKTPGSSGYGVTASGLRAAYGVVAVDRNVIPLGSKLYIESLDSWPDYGYAVAGDTGGAIKGNRIDLFMESRSEALSFGRRNVKVYVLN